MSKIKIGLFGFGCVGQGLYHVLEQTKGIKADIIKIAVKDKTKKRPLPDSFFTFDKNEILKNPEINTIVELIDDPDEAYLIVKDALEHGKNVVTANKKMLALHLKELVALQQKNKVALLYEGAACGSIPIIRNLEEYYDNDLLTSISGIFNGSSNYILTRIFNEGLSYEDALKHAQDLGFAESDPTLDVQAYDPLYKLVILATHAFGVFVHPDEVFNFGIHTLHEADFQYAREKGFKIKVVPQARKTGEDQISLFVIPQFVKPIDYLYNVEYEYNGVTVQSAFADKQFLLGKGAGGNPTGSAVLSDISALAFDYHYEYKKLSQNGHLKYDTDIELAIYFRFANEKDKTLFPFTEIYETLTSKDFSYITGKVKLKDLLDANEALLDSKSFVAQLPETTAKTKVDAITKEEEAMI